MRTKWRKTVTTTNHNFSVQKTFVNRNRSLYRNAPSTSNWPRNSIAKKRSKGKLKGLYEVLATSSNIVTASTSTSKFKEPGKKIVRVRNSDISKFDSQIERQSPFKIYADKCGSRNRIITRGKQSKKQSHIN